MYMFGKVSCIKKRARNLYKIIEEKPSRKNKKLKEKYLHNNFTLFLHIP